MKSQTKKIITGLSEFLILGSELVWRSILSVGCVLTFAIVFGVYYNETNIATKTINFLLPLIMMWAVIPVLLKAIFSEDKL